MPFLPTVEYSCCGFSLRLGVVLSSWFFLMVDISILVIYLMEAISTAELAAGNSPAQTTTLDVSYLLRAHHSPLDAFESSRGHLRNLAKASEGDIQKGAKRIAQNAVLTTTTTTTKSVTTELPAEKPRGVLVAQVPLAVCFIAVDIMLLLGVWSDSRVLLVTWMVVTGARACLELLVMVAVVVRWVGEHVAPPSLALRLMLRLVIVLCEGYCIVVTYSYYQIMAALCSAYENHHAIQSQRTNA